MESPRKKETQRITCLNCGSEGSGNYCSSCGQKYSELKRPLKELFEEVFDSLDLDRRLLKSIIPFIIKPGFLAKEYLAGRRKSYTSPLRLYLLMSFLFFFLAQITSNKAINNPENSLFQIGSDSLDGVVLDEAAALELLKNDTLHISEEVLAGGKSGIRKAKREQRLKESLIKAFTEKDFFIQSLYKNISYILFILMPVFALILKLLYIRRNKFYIEHLLFSLNMHSFALLVFSIIVLLSFIFPSASIGFELLVLLIPVYFTAGMRNFYKQAWGKIIVKEFILAVFYSLLLALSLIVVLILTLFTM